MVTTTRLAGRPGRSSDSGDRLKPAGAPGSGHAGTAFGCGTDRKLAIAGESRARSATDTLRLLRPELARLGITRVADITGLDNVGIPVVMVIRPNGRSLSVSQGKGITLDAARVSGIMEALEQHHAERIDTSVRLARHVDLARWNEIVDIDEVARPAECGDPIHVRLPWIEARTMGAGEQVLVPLELVDIDSTVPSGYRRGHFVACTNGLASGNTLVEAEVHALSEVIERDARTLWELADAWCTTRVDPGSIDDESCCELLDRFEAAGISVAIWDMTSDVGIASFVVVLAQRGAGLVRGVPLAEGAGCHPDRGIALRRALTEAVQARLTLIAGSRDDIGRGDLAELGAERRREQGWNARIEADSCLRSFGDIASRHNDTVSGDRSLLLRSLRQANVPDPLVVDLTRPEFGVPVVKVIVPTLEAALERRARLGHRAQRALAS